MTEHWQHDRVVQRFELWIDSQLAGQAHYSLDGDIADFDHTQVPPQFEGQGVASRLMRHAMDEIRSEGKWKVLPSCTYVAHWFKTHPDYADLLAR